MFLKFFYDFQIVDEAVRKQLKQTFKEGVGNDFRRLIKRAIYGQITKKYRVCSLLRSNWIPQLKKVTPKARSSNSLAIREFYLNNSQIDPGKKAYISRKKIKTQIRWLNASMIDLHVRYCLENEKVAYSTFAKYRPFFCKIPKVTARDTCACLKHENFKNVIQVLHKEKIISENSVEQVINNLVCDDRDNKCFSRTCPKCRDKKIVKKLNNSNLAAKTSYYHWSTIKEERTNQKTKKKFFVTRTVKNKCSPSLENLLQIFQNQLDAMLIHVQNIIHHYKKTKDKKEDLTPNQGVFHIDFSENINCKYGTEVQSVHFGASRKQISLHTGMFYTKDFHEGFATVSSVLDHGSYAIIAHLRPVIKNYLAKHPTIDELYIISDSTCGQYRNRNTFFLLTQYLTKQFPTISKIVWSFSEAGHGKGPADGIGAVIKRMLDDLVKYGEDIPDLEAVLAAFEKKMPNLFFCNILPESISEVKKNLPAKVKAFKGTLNVRQLIWYKNNEFCIFFNRLSCFECLAGKICSHFFMGKLEYTIPSQIQSKAINLRAEIPETRQDVSIEMNNNEAKKVLKKPKAISSKAKNNEPKNILQKSTINSKKPRKDKQKNVTIPKIIKSEATTQSTRVRRAKKFPIKYFEDYQVELD